jgi:hypothetical protein
MIYTVKSFQSENLGDTGLAVQRPDRYADHFVFSIGKLGKTHDLEIKLDQGMVTNLIRFLQGHQ